MWIDGLGVVNEVDTTLDPDTGKPRLAGVSMTWLAAEKLLRIATNSGETLVSSPVGMKPIYDDLRKTK